MIGRAIVPVVAAAVSVALAGGCAKPSPLDGVVTGASYPGEAADLVAWRTLATRARPLDAGGDLLDRALAERDPARQLAALEAWVAAGGRLADVPPVRAVDAADQPLALGVLGIAAATAGARDDAALEAALYLAQRLRRDGLDMTAAAAAVAIVREAISVRPHAPASAARYAPSDAEVARAFAAEALAVARLAAWSTTADAERVPGRGGASYRELARTGEAAAGTTGAAGDGDPLAKLSWMADAPTDRAGFLLALTRHADAQPDLAYQAHLLYDSVDAYQRWLRP